MNLELTDEQLALRDTVRRFLAAEAPIAGHVRPLLDGDTGATRPVQDGLAALGTTGVLVPERHGGAGLTMVEAGIVAEELGRAVFPGPWASTAVAAVRALTRLGDDTSAAKLLSGIADGSVVATLALREPGRGPASWTGPAARADGDRVTGEKVEVPDAAAADVLLVLADDGSGAGLYSVDRAGPGVAVTRQPGIDGTRKQFAVALDGAPAERLGDAPPDAVQAVVDDVLLAAAPPAAVQAVVDDVVLAAAADALGAASAVFELALGYAKVREQFGQPIGAFQAVQHLCVDMFETIELARGGVLHGLWAADAGAGARAGHHLDAVRAKAFAGRLATVADQAVQVLGGIGYTWEHDAHLYAKRLLSWSAFLGAPDPYLHELGRHLTTTGRAG